MVKALCMSGYVVAALLVLVFGLDVAIGIPFGGISKLMDIGMIIAAGILGYVSWAAMREAS